MVFIDNKEYIALQKCFLTKKNNCFWTLYYSQYPILLLPRNLRCGHHGGLRRNLRNRRLTDGLYLFLRCTPSYPAKGPVKTLSLTWSLENFSKGSLRKVICSGCVCITFMKGCMMVSRIEAGLPVLQSLTKWYWGKYCFKNSWIPFTVPCKKN